MTQGTGAPGLPDEPRDWNDDDSSLKVYLGLLRRQWWCIPVCVVLGLLLALLYVRGGRPAYELKAQILVQDTTARPQLPSTLSALVPVGLAGRGSLANDIELVRSWSVKCLAVQLVRDQPELIQTATSGTRRIASFLDIPQEVRATQVDWQVYETELRQGSRLVGLLEGLQARNPRDTSVLELSSQSGDPQASAEALTAATLAYLITKWRLARATIDDSLPALLREQSRAKERLDRAAQNLREFQEHSLPLESGVGSLEEARNAYLELVDLQKQRWAAEGNRAAQAAQVTYLRGKTRELEPELITSSQLAANPVVSQLQTQLAAAYGQRLAVLKDYAPDTPEVQAADRRIQELRNQINAEIQTVTTAQTKSLNPIYQQTLNQLATAQASELAANEQVRTLDEAIAKLRAKMARLPRDTRTLTELTVELEAAQKLYGTIRENVEQLRISAETQANSPRVITPAMVRPHLAPIRPQKRSALASGFIGGLVLGVLLAFLVEHRNGRNGSSRRRQEEAPQAEAP